jgi:MORN repeat variant
MNEILVQAPTNPLFNTALWIDLDYRSEDSAELYEGMPFTGLVYDYDTKTGSLIKEKSYWNGGLHGFVKEWHSNGQVRLECRYFHGDIYGNLKEWHENGTLKREVICWSSLYQLRRKTWDEFGNLTEIYYIKDDKDRLKRYMHRKKNTKRTLPLRKNWVSIRSPELIDFNKRIQLYLRTHPFTAIEPKKR